MATGCLNVLDRSVRLVLNNWTVLQLAVEQGFGGIDSREKARWLEDVVLHVLDENDVLDYTELEDYIGDILYNEFHTLAEDGSLTKVSQKLIMFQKLWKEGNIEVMEKEICATKPTKLSNYVKQKADHSFDGTKDQDSQTTAVSEQMEGLQIAPSSACSNCQSNQQIDEREPSTRSDSEMASSSTKTDKQQEEDGWEVVRRSKKKH
ncbi:predicted protein [Nematostella vectensis]|uniref:Pre-rRNA-processing protein TSR2 homolog n=1 Tax=Nematostella vectensis TaxID=45351 RepID=A7SEI2_NEMVE|nr:pre-rRNA-processing protein TSR2 homolog [Nematostella vectensis]EDO37866.1 predicted protein [Nematostella vectensis]|eukprot:XP_001629929.1 predicted protein [Nematostella vectensis]